MKEPSVVVSILAFHSADTIEWCVRSCLELEHAGPLTIVVREQGEDPAEADIVARVACDAGEGGPRVELVRSANMGFSGGHNATVRSSGSDFVLVLNADAAVEPGMLREALAAFDDPIVGAVQPKVVSTDAGTRVIDSAGLLPRRNRQFATRGHGHADDGTFDTGEAIFGPDGAVALFRRSALDDVAIPFAAFARRDPPAGVEYFDESFFAYKEDVDLAWRLQWRGWTTRYVPAATASHRRSARTTADGSARRAVGDRLRMPSAVRSLGFANQRLMQVKNDDLRALGRSIAPWVGRETAAWGFGLVTDPRLVRAIGRMTRLMPMAVRKRRWIREHRAPGADPYRWFA